MKAGITAIAAAILTFCQTAHAEDIPLTVTLKYLPSKAVETVIVKQGNSLFIRAEDFQQLYPKAVDVKPIQLDGEQFMPLAHLGILEIDPATLTAKLALKPDFMPSQQFNPFTKIYDSRPKPENGFRLNYMADYDSSQKTFSAQLEPVFSLASGSIGRALLNTNSTLGTKLLSWNFKTYDLTGNSSWSLGNATSTSTAISRPFGFIGYQLASNFDLEPYRTPFVSSTLAGTSDLAGVAELFLNGNKVAQQEIRPGNFSFDGLTSPYTSTGQAVLVVKDINGRTQTLTAPLLGSPRNLKEGFKTYGLEAGFLGSDITKLGKPFVSGTMSYGLTNSITVQGHVEATKDRQNLSAGGLFATELGTFKAGLSVGSGTIANVGFFRTTKDLNLSLDYTRFSRQQSIADRSPRTDSMFVATASGKVFNQPLNLSYARSSIDSRLAVGTSWQLMKNGYLQTVVSRSNTSGWGAYIGFSLSFGRAQISSGYDSPSKTFSNSLNLPGQINEPSYFVSNRHGPTGTDSWAQASYSTESVDLFGALSKNRAYGAVRGSAVIVDSSVVLSRPIPDAYVIVDSGEHDIYIKTDSLDKGSTKKGKMVIPIISLSSYDITIDTEKLPDELAIDQEKYTVRAFPNSNVRIKVKTVRID